MKKIVSPTRWIDRNKVEHPPLMMRYFMQGVCGGLRWLETKEMAEYITKRALETGYPASKAERAAYQLPSYSSSSSMESNNKSARQRKTTKSNKQCSASRKNKETNLSLSTALHRKSNEGKELVCSTDTSRALASLSSNSEALTLLSQPRERLVTYDVLDCTFGSGYHTGCILHNGAPYTRVIAMDCDYAVQPFAKNVAAEFGADRFRFFAHNMSEAQSLFGEEAFDAIVIDPGPSFTQLDDPARGFILESDLNSLCDGDHALDMRYGPHRGQNALSYLNVISQHSLASSLHLYELLSREQSIKLARAIHRNRPFHGAYSVISAIEEAGNELPEDGWMTQDSFHKVHMSWKFFTSLRCIINDEYNELRISLENAFLLLKDDGRLVVYTRLPWEEQMVNQIISTHPHGLLCYKEKIDTQDVVQYGHTRHTQMWVATKTATSAAVLKNAVTLTTDDVKESSIRWMAGTYAGQSRGFPAENMTFSRLSHTERETQMRNAQSPPFDYCDDDDDNSWGSQDVNQFGFTRSRRGPPVY